MGPTRKGSYLGVETGIGSRTRCKDSGCTSSSSAYFGQSTIQTERGRGWGLCESDRVSARTPMRPSPHARPRGPAPSLRGAGCPPSNRRKVAPTRRWIAGLLIPALVERPVVTSPTPNPSTLRSKGPRAGAPRTGRRRSDSRRRQTKRSKHPLGCPYWSLGDPTIFYTRRDQTQLNRRKRAKSISHYS